METVPPNTIIHLPPAHRRTTSEIGLLIFTGIVVPLVILWLLFRVTVAPSPVSANPTPLHDYANDTTPVVVEVVMKYPDQTPETAPRSAWAPTATSTSDWCDARFTQPGDACLKPFPPPPTPTPLLSCESAMVDAGDLCRWTEPDSPTDLWGISADNRR